VKFYIDSELRGAEQMVCGANERDYHIIGFSVINFNDERFADLSAVRAGDACPCCGEPLSVRKGMEVGHIFQLGTKYSEPMGATFLDENGKAQPFQMGSYGIGVSRLVAVAVESSHDERGIIWPRQIAPFELSIIISNHKDADICAFASEIYEKCLARGVRVLLDDRAERFGVKMNDYELMGFPHALIIGKGLSSGKVEWIDRRGLAKSEISVDEIWSKIEQMD